MAVANSSFHSRAVPGLAVALPQSWGALKPPSSRSRAKGIPRVLIPVLVHPKPRGSLDAPQHPPMLPPLSLLWFHPQPLSNLDLELTLPLHSPGDLRPSVTIPPTLPFSFPVRPELQPDPQAPVSLTPDIPQPHRTPGQELGLMLTPLLAMI